MKDTLLSVSLLLVSQPAFAASHISCKATLIPPTKNPPAPLPEPSLPVDLTMEITNNNVNGYQILIQTDSASADSIATLTVVDLLTGRTTSSVVAVKPQDKEAGAQNMVYTLLNSKGPDEKSASGLLIHCSTRAK
jgi:hypothetical protein